MQFNFCFLDILTPSISKSQGLILCKQPRLTRCMYPGKSVTEKTGKSKRGRNSFLLLGWFFSSFSFVFTFLGFWWFYLLFNLGVNIEHLFLQLKCICIFSPVLCVHIHAYYPKKSVGLHFYFVLEALYVLGVLIFCYKCKCFSRFIICIFTLCIVRTFIFK